MTDGQRYSVDTDALRDVAQSEMYPIAENLEATRLAYLGTESSADEAFGEATIKFGDQPIASYGPFGGVQERWTEITGAIAFGLRISEERIQDGAEALQQIAEDYDQDEAQAVAEFDSLGNSLGDN